MHSILADSTLAPETHERSDAWARSLGLTPREAAIAALVVRGLTNREVACLLACSPLTVRNHLHAVFLKADVSTRAELTFVVMSAQRDERC